EHGCADAHGPYAPDDGKPVFAADALVDDGDVRGMAFQSRKEAHGVEREGRLEPFEPEEHAQGFACSRIGIEDMDEAVAVEEEAVAPGIGHYTLRDRCAAALR